LCNVVTFLTSIQLFVCLRESVDRKSQVFPRMRGTDLSANAGGAMRHPRIKEADCVDTFRQHAGGELLRPGGIADHDWHDWMNSRFNCESTLDRKSVV